jgi:hypothetical protein
MVGRWSVVVSVFCGSKRRGGESELSDNFCDSR